MRTAVGFPCQACGGGQGGDRVGADIIELSQDKEGNVALRLHCGRCENVWWARKLAGEEWQHDEDGLPT